MRVSRGLVVMLVAATLACGARDEKQVPQADAEAIAQDMDALDQLRSAGSDLAKPHKVEFYLYLPSEADAEAAGAELRSRGYGVAVQAGENETNWLCLASRTMIPTIQDLSEARGVFKTLAFRHRGAYDGWQAGIER